jgi:IS66 Orf2 like protein
MLDFEPREKTGNREVGMEDISGHLFVFRGRRGDLVKIIWFDGKGACLFFLSGLNVVIASGQPRAYRRRNSGTHKRSS